MKLKIFLHRPEGRLPTAYVKLSIGEYWSESLIPTFLQEKYGRDIQYVIFEGHGEIQDYLFHSMAVGDIEAVITDTPDELFETVDFES